MGGWWGFGRGGGGQGCSTVAAGVWSSAALLSCELTPPPPPLPTLPAVLLPAAPACAARARAAAGAEPRCSRRLGLVPVALQPADARSPLRYARPPAAASAAGLHGWLLLAPVGPRKPRLQWVRSLRWHLSSTQPPVALLPHPPPPACSRPPGAAAAGAGSRGVPGGGGGGGQSRVTALPPLGAAVLCCAMLAARQARGGSARQPATGPACWRDPR